MILTGREIQRQLHAGRINIDPFNDKYLESNSYGFHLGPDFTYYEDPILDPAVVPKCGQTIHSTERGMTLLPGLVYLGHTKEVMGSDFYASTLYANRSVASLGVWIQISAPLGHVGAVISWTLEIRVTQPTVLYPGMNVGKIAFWCVEGLRELYKGRYSNSVSVVPSLSYHDWTEQL